MSAHLHARHRGAHCARTGPLPLLPSGPGGVGGIASRGTRPFHSSKAALFIWCVGRVFMKGWAAHAMNGELHPTSSALKRSVEGYFELSLFAMVAVAFMTLAGTGKLDPVSLLFVVTGLGIRAYLLATRRNFQLSLKTTNRLTVFYFFFYPLDFLVISRSFVDATIH